MEQIARKLGVSSNAIRKWICKYGITIKAQKHKGFKRTNEAIEKGRVSLKEFYKNHKSPLGKTIVQIAPTGDIIKFFNSIAEVATHGFNRKMVAKAIQGKLKTYLGFVWKECVIVKEWQRGRDKQHLPKDAIKLFRCEVCGKVFKSLRVMQRHRKEQEHYILCRHDWCCPFCGDMLASRRKLYKHMHEMHMEKRIYKCKFCGAVFTNHYKLGAHSLHCKENPKFETNLQIIKKTAGKNHPKHLSKTTRTKISNSMKRFLTNHPESASYKRYHYSKGSWAELYFIKLFTLEGIEGYVTQYHIGRYRLDFAFPSTKVDFEVDGHQHYVDKRIISHDKERTKNLTALGWKTIRLDWRYFSKLTYQERKEWLQKNLYPFIPMPSSAM